MDIRTPKLESKNHSIVYKRDISNRIKEGTHQHLSLSLLLRHEIPKKKKQQAQGALRARLSLFGRALIRSDNTSTLHTQYSLSRFLHQRGIFIYT